VSIRVSGYFEASPPSGTGPVLSFNVTGSGSVSFSGTTDTLMTGPGTFGTFSELEGFGATFTGTADVISPVPEPGSFFLFGTGLIVVAMLVWARWRSRLHERRTQRGGPADPSVSI
jgi:hypothetical protein